MGGPGSGRGLKADEEKAAAAAAKARRTADTDLFLQDEAFQRGDRLFKIVRIYDGGLKATLGTIDAPTDAAIGARFGGGVYEVRELDRATERETGRVVKRTLHPAAFPPVAEFDQDPYTFERNRAREQRAQRGAPPVGVGMHGANPEEIFERAKAAAKAEMEREFKERELSRSIADINTRLDRLASGDMGGARRNMTEELAAVLDLVKKITPPPAPNYAPPVDPAAQLTQTLELFKTMKGALTELGTQQAGQLTPFGERLISSLTDLANRGLTVWQQNEANQQRRNLGAPAAPAAPDPNNAGWARTSPPPAAPPSNQAHQQTAPAAEHAAAPAGGPYAAGWARTAGGPAPAPEPAAAAAAPEARDGWPQTAKGYTLTREDFPTEQEFQQFQADAMTFELVELVRRDMNAQLSNQPGFSIFKTCETIRARWSEPNAGQAWLQLRDGLRTYPTAALVDHFCGLQPDLCPTAQHRQWLGTLIEVIKEREGVKA